MRLSVNEEAAFASLAREVFALDTAIQWFALQKAGREPCCARRDAETGPDAEPVDPFVLMLAEGHDGSYGEEDRRNPRGLSFVVLAYTGFVEIVARFGRYDYAGVAANRKGAVCTVGRSRTETLERKPKKA